MGLSEEELQPLVSMWRSSNPNIVKFWWEVDRAAMNAVQKRIDGEVSSTYRMRGEAMYAKIARSILAVTGVKRGNYLVFFPSHAFLNGRGVTAGDRFDSKE